MDTTFPDLGSLTDQELKDLIRELTAEEMEISYRRRILHGQDRHPPRGARQPPRKKDESGELVITGADVQQLTDILAGRGPVPRRMARATEISGGAFDELEDYGSRGGPALP